MPAKRQRQPRLRMPRGGDTAAEPSRRRVRTLVRRLLSWYARHARDLPWRRTSDPYAIWISEVMLQQTQVQTVIPYWQRWMAHLPDVHALAAAPQASILKLWEGLGYYHRAKNLQRAAQVIVHEHQGRFPREHSALLALPGIGPYTAGAICSIAFHQPQPILDGNITRVFCRLFGIESAPTAPRTQVELWALAQQMVRIAAHPPFTDAAPPRRIDSGCGFPDGTRSAVPHFNQSLMELGALICTPRSPRCAACPVRRLCVAHRQGRVEELPCRARRPAITAQRLVTLVARRAHRLWVRHRPAGIVNAHLWEFPNLKLTRTDPRAVERWLANFGLRPTQLSLLGTVRHSITRYRITRQVHQCDVPHAAWNPQAQTGCWVSLSDLADLALTAADRKILRLIRAHPN